MIIHINVTPDLIERGIPQSETHCPIALALDAALGDAVFALSVGDTIMIEWKDDNRQFIECNTPEKLWTFIHNFDNGETVQPFEYDLEFNDGVNEYE